MLLLKLIVATLVHSFLAEPTLACHKDDQEPDRGKVLLTTRVTRGLTAELPSADVAASRPAETAKPRTVLVTGGAGFIGSHAVAKLLESGHRVIVIDNFSRSTPGVMDVLHSIENTSTGASMMFYDVDLHDRKTVTNILMIHKPDVVLHFAGVAFVQESHEKPLLYFENITSDTISLLQSMSAANVTRIIYSSSCATYGDSARLPITEETVQQPVSPYGKAKLLAETVIKSWAGLTPGAKVGILRYFNVIGGDPKLRLGETTTSNSSKTARILPMLFRAVLEGEPFQLNGDDFSTRDGSAERDFVHVVDLVHAHILLMESFSRSNETTQTYNVGTGRPTSMLQLIRMVEKATKQSIQKVVKTRKPGDPATVVADASKISRLLGWSPRFSDLETTVRHAWAFRMSHTGGYDGQQGQSDGLWLQPRFDRLLKVQHHADVTDVVALSETTTASLVVGILGREDAVAERMQHRRTWMQQQCVHLKAGCTNGHVKVLFVVERSKAEGLAKESVTFGDMAIVETGGNLAAKPLAWFKYAAHSFPKATFIGKMDTDTFIHPCALVHHLGQFQSSSLYYGNREPWLKENVHFMQGGFYVVSLDVATWLARSSYASRHIPSHYGGEDAQFGLWMDYAKATDFPHLRFNSVATVDCNKMPCESWNPPQGSVLFKHLYKRRIESGVANDVLDVP